MDRRKLVLLGVPGVGKTSLIGRWVKGIFSERYLSTIGVKIDKKELEVAGESLLLQIWDLAGAFEVKGPAQAYVRGADACLLVADGTRPETLEEALTLGVRARELLGPIPVTLALNKVDLGELWQVSRERIRSLEKSGLILQVTSARTGEGVLEVFDALARQLVAGGSAKERAG